MARQLSAPEQEDQGFESLYPSKRLLASRHRRLAGSEPDAARNSGNRTRRDSGASAVHRSADRRRSISVRTDGRLRPFFALGNELFHRREGQLNLSCSQCHDDNWGQRLAGSMIPQGHPTGYPLYRLEWQSLGSLQRRLRNCVIGVRAEPYGYGAPEAVALELYLMERASGMPIETPAVRP
jgi:L-cysteine S-thiosulfotransferase